MPPEMIVKTSQKTWTRRERKRKGKGGREGKREGKGGREGKKEGKREGEYDDTDGGASCVSGCAREVVFV